MDDPVAAVRQLADTIQTLEALVAETTRLMAAVQQTMSDAREWLQETQELEEELHFLKAELRDETGVSPVDTPPPPLPPHPKFRPHT